MKILLQRTWELNLGWEDSIPKNILNTRRRWRSELTQLSQLVIPRCYVLSGKKIELHGFCDASKEAYAGVVYIDHLSQHHISLVAAKTIVAPIKKLTIPRLELCGTLTVTRLIQHAREILSLTRTFGLTAPSCMLGWLTGNPCRLKTYDVANRVTEIVEVPPPPQSMESCAH